jgi:hypothetical protein
MSSRFARDDDDVLAIEQSSLRWPEKCDRGSCERDTAVAFARAKRDGGREFVVNGGAVIERVSRAQKDELRVRPGWQMLGWIARCAECYSHEVAKAGKSQMYDILGDVPYATQAAISAQAERRKKQEG